MPRVSVPSPSGQSPQGQSIGGPGHPGGLNAQTQLRIQRVARMEIVGISDKIICQREGFDHAALKYLRSLSDYQEIRDDLLQGHLTKMDEAMAGNIEILRREVRQAVPAALRCLIDTVNQRKDLRTALAAASELLDRDPDKLFLKSKEVGAIPASGDLPTSLQDEVTKAADEFANSSKKVM